jgi:hypothetical protein
MGSYASIVLVQMHEIGHILYMHHSGEGSRVGLGCLPPGIFQNERRLFRIGLGSQRV